MRISAILLITGMLHIYAEGYSQETKLSLEATQAGLKEVIKQIENQSEFLFLYNAHDIDDNIKVNIKVRNQHIDHILNMLLRETGLEYIIVDRHILLRPNKKPEESDTSVEENIQQGIAITGTVTDEAGEPMPGVNVIIKGTTTGVVTGADGKYNISVPDRDAVLMFSFMGYVTQEITVGDRTNIEVILNEDVRELEEVIVVGYGIQKKVNLSGSVTVVNAKELETISVPSIAQAIMGRSPGVFIKNKKGQPGEFDATDFNIRGFDTPLIIVDGSPVTSSYFQQLTPQDIESFNVLKDASAAAVYGARAGNGVILVTTKRGTVSAPEISYTGSYGWQFFTKRPHFVNSAQYASMHNVGRVYFEGLDPLYTDEEIKKYKDGTDPNYPSVDWWKLTFRDYTPQQEHSLTARGGTEKVKYFTSLGYYNQKGVHVSDDVDHSKISLRSNIDIKLTKNFNVGVDLSLINQKYIGPSMMLERPASGGSQIMGRLMSIPPYAVMPELPDPSYLPAVSDGSYGNPYLLGFIDNVGFKKFNKLYGFAKLNFEYKLPFNIVAKAVFDMNRTYSRERERVLVMKQYSYDELTGEYTLRRTDNQYDYLDENNSISNNFNQQYYLTWDQTFGNHQIGATFVYESLREDFDYLRAFRRDYELPIDYLFAGPDANQQNGGYATEGGRRAFIGRINYNYMGKYILETSARYDGSPKFPADTRWGFFPSASVAWRISEESFIKDNLPIIKNLKLRASHGKLGYDGKGDFQYLATFSIKSQYIYDTDLQSGLRANGLPNTSITWEKMTLSNIGLDFNFWDGRLLEGYVEYFYRKRSDVLGKRGASIPNVVGATLPDENINEYDNRGWEFVLRHSHKIGDIEYSVGANLSTNREKALSIADQEEFASKEAYRRGNKVGEWTDRTWLLPTDGLFRTQEEIDNWADIDGYGNRTIAPGDIRYVDYNNDGRITSEDQILAGRGTMPRLIFGLDISVSWKGFSIVMLWQGAGLFNYNLSAGDRRFMMPFYGTPNTWMYENMYTPENPWIPANLDAKWPRYGTDPANRNHPNFARNNDFWLIDGTYIRLKNLEIGYTLPNTITKRWGVSNCKIYVSGYNLWTITKDNFDFVDPEADTSPKYGFGDYHPVMGNYNVGVQMNFGK